MTEEQNERTSVVLIGSGAGDEPKEKERESAACQSVSACAQVSNGGLGSELLRRIAADCSSSVALNM